MAKHQWTKKDDVVAFFLYKFGDEDLIFDTAAIAEKLGMSKKSLIARKGNFKYLDTGKGLSHVANSSESIYEKLKDVSKPKFLSFVKKILYPQK
ncbi:hypothetical protein [Desulfobacula sp.]|jgi:hypothetical protein|uniref:hypothetical protein n=1 Tax=Desulfobacula sp. TaxID=2593537 RepID=UPI001DFC0AE3|nr:hypothetical protein [Bacteroidota bacterium]MBT4024852.1 hypothetical protein [Desulfobacula sp.]MBT4968013.1 hypothetical protein [Bacteroidota bacterium]MBT7794786.1 hypothetical protein [Desulfobacula sp.]